MAYIGPEPNPGQNREVDDISGSFNGSTTAFTLQVGGANVSPGSANAIIVSVGGVIQNPGTDYTVAASTLTFTTAPASGLSFFGLVLGQGIDSQTIADGQSPTMAAPSITGDLSIADKIVHTGDTNTAIRFPAADTITTETGGSERVRIDSSGRILQGSSTGRNTALMAAQAQHQIEGVGSNASSFSIFCNSTGTAAGAIIFSKSKGNSLGSSTVVQENDSLGHIAFEGTDGSQNRTGARITASVDGTPGSNVMPARLSFFTTQDGSGSGTERLRIQQNGNVMIGTASHFTSNVAKLDVVHGGGGTNNPTYMARFFQETNDQGDDHGCIQLRHEAARSGQNGVGIDFKNSGGTSVGKIDFGQSTVQYRTSSDYRLKEKAVSISDGITRLKTLKPYRFNFISEPDKTVDGFFAHEVTAVPEAISGTKDEVDADNNPIYQGIDQSKLVPLLTAALQEAITKIETLETKVAALESA